MNRAQDITTFTAGVLRDRKVWALSGPGVRANCLEDAQPVGIINRERIISVPIVTATPIASLVTGESPLGLA